MLLPCTYLTYKTIHNTYYPQAVKSQICIEVADLFQPPICCTVPEKVWERCIGPVKLSEMNKITHRNMQTVDYVYNGSAMMSSHHAFVLWLDPWQSDTSQIITVHSINFTITAIVLMIPIWWGFMRKKYQLMQDKNFDYQVVHWKGQKGTSIPLLECPSPENH